MGQWSREEIEETFVHHQESVVEIGKSWDWARYGELFTEDATYTEHLYGKMAGRKQISEWIASTMNSPRYGMMALRPNGPMRLRNIPALESNTLPCQANTLTNLAIFSLKLAPGATIAVPSA